MYRPPNIRILALVGLAAGCGDLTSPEYNAPPVPDGYPELTTEDSSRAELDIDGESYSGEGGQARHNADGFEGGLTVSLSFIILELGFAELEVREFTVSDGDLVARYSPTVNDTAIADGDCGSGSLTIAGLETYDSGSGVQREVIYGDLDLTLCKQDEGQSTVSGRFSAIVDRS